VLVAFTVLLRRWSIGGVRAAAAVAASSAAVVIPLFALTQDWSRILALPLPVLATQVVEQGVLSGVHAVIAHGTAVRHLGASRAALFPALVPAATLVVGLPVTGEMPLPLEWAGAALATVGLAVAMGGFRRWHPARG